MKKHVHKAARTTEFCACGAVRTDEGGWEVGKGPHAMAMAAKAIAMSTPEQRRQIAAAGGAERWKGTTAKERCAFMSRVASQPRLGRRIEDRCECGRYSRVYPEKWGHLCGKALEARLKEAENGR
jgi:hypothetical protein